VQSSHLGHCGRVARPAFVCNGRLNPSAIRWVVDSFDEGVGLEPVDEKEPKNAKIDVTVDVTSIDTRQEMRDNHLRSADFFDVANHPEMHFVSKRIEGDLTRTFKVIGDLTIRGTTREVALDVAFEGRAKDPWGNDRAGFSATGKLNRREFGLLWNQALEAGGVAVCDEVKLSLDVELVRQAAAQTSVAA